MHNEDIIQDLFEAARSEQPARAFAHAETFLKTDLSGTRSNLVIKWLKQYKMNILITTSGIVITATIFLFPELEATENAVIQQIPDATQEIVEVPKESMVTSLQAEDTTNETAKNPVIKTVKDDPIKEETMTEPVDSSEQKIVLVPTPKTTYTQQVHDFENLEPKKYEEQEHTIVLESKGGKASAEKFDNYLREHLSRLNPEMKSSASSSTIRKFSLRLDNGLQANFRMQVTGFEKLELHWEIDENNEIKDMWYKLNGGKVKKMNFSKETKSSVKVTHKHSDF